MKLSYKYKLNIYGLKKQGIPWSQISENYGVKISNLKYMVKLMDRYDIEVIKKSKMNRYPPELKQEIMNKVLLEGQSQLSVSIDYAIPNAGMFPNWLSQYKKNGYTILKKQRGRPR